MDIRAARPSQRRGNRKRKITRHAEAELHALARRDVVESEIVEPPPHRGGGLEVAVFGAVHIEIPEIDLICSLSGGHRVAGSQPALDSVTELKSARHQALHR